MSLDFKPLLNTGVNNGVLTHFRGQPLQRPDLAGEHEIQCYYVFSEHTYVAIVRHVTAPQGGIHLENWSALMVDRTGRITAHYERTGMNDAGSLFIEIMQHWKSAIF
jgi:hypothetical protein